MSTCCNFSPRKEERSAHGFLQGELRTSAHPDPAVVAARAKAMALSPPRVDESKMTEEDREKMEKEIATDIQHAVLENEIYKVARDVKFDGRSERIAEKK